MAIIQISDQIYQKLADQANTQKMSVDAFVEPMLADYADELDKRPNGQTHEQWQQWLADWNQRAKARASNYPPGFQLDDSRDSIYEGR